MQPVSFLSASSTVQSCAKIYNEKLPTAFLAVNYMKTIHKAKDRRRLRQIYRVSQNKSKAEKPNPDQTRSQQPSDVPASSSVMPADPSDTANLLKGS
jgi:hypothetical protein